MKDDTSTPITEGSSPNEFERGKPGTAARDQGNDAASEELADTLILRDLGARLVPEDNLQTIYDEVLTAAIKMTGARAGTVQMLDPVTEELVTLATRGFSQTVDYFYRVDAASNTSCGAALRSGERAHFEFDPDSDDIAARLHVNDGVLSAQSTPLRSRAGKAIGMVSTHWGEPHYKMSERQERFLDLLARQAGDLLEQRAFLHALGESENKYRTLFEKMGQGYVLAKTVRDADGRPIDMLLLQVNPAYERLMGVSADQARGRGAYEVLPGVDRWWLETCDRIAREGKPERVEYQYNEDGRWFEAWVYPHGEDRYEVLFEDISERKRAEEKLRHSEERQAFLLQLSDALRHLSQASDIQMTASRLLGDQLDVSRAMYAEMIGDEKTDGAVIRGQHVREGDRFPDRIPSTMFDETFVGGSMWTDNRVVMADIASDPRIREDARRAWLASGIAAAVAVTLVKDGRLVAIFGVHHTRPRPWSADEVTLIEEVAERTWDAAERARAEAALRESEQRFRLAIEGSKLAVYECDLDLRYTWIANPVAGWDPADIVGRTDDDLLPAEYAHILMDFKRRALMSDTPVEEELEGVPSGTLGWYLMRAERLTNEDGSIRGLRVLALDITALKRVEQSLRKSERHSQTLLAELQHRVRNTLGIVRSIARRTAENSDNVEEMVGHFQGRLDAFSRVQAALTRSPDAVADLASLIEDEMVAHAARDGQQVSLQGPEIELDAKTAERLSLAIHELTTNAVKHGAFVTAEGHVRIRWSIERGAEGDKLVLDWTESGVTIDPRENRRSGFGMELLERSLPYDLLGETKIEFRPHGLRFELRMPLGPREDDG